MQPDSSWLEIEFSVLYPNMLESVLGWNVLEDAQTAKWGLGHKCFSLKLYRLLLRVLLHHLYRA